jgi:hypothetical protein
MPVGYAVVGPLAAAAGLRPTAIGLTVVSAGVCLAVAASPALRRLVAVPLSGERDEVHEVV